MTNSYPAAAQAENFFEPETHALRVHVLYEDSETGLRARRGLECLVDRLQLEADFQVRLCRFDLLHEPAFREMADHEAEQADVLLVSGHGEDALPLAVISWIEQWLRHAYGEPRALVLSFDPGAAESISAHRTLASLGLTARAAGVDVFPHFAEPLQSKLEATFGEIHYRAETQTALLSEPLRQWESVSHRHWGINE